MSDPTPARTTHEQLNAPDADISLISSDNVQLKVKKGNLAATSVVFRDMLETGSSGDEIPMAEEGDVLEAVLPYCYPEPVTPLDIFSDDFWDVIKTFDKYQIGRGMDAAAYACELEAARDPSINAIMINYVFVSHFRRDELPIALRYVFRNGLSASHVDEGILRDILEQSGLSDDDNLSDLLLRREAALQRARDGPLANAFARRLGASSKSDMAPADVAAAVRVWAGAGQYRSARHVREYVYDQVAERGGSLKWAEQRWLPWDELESALDDLPDDL